MEKASSFPAPSSLLFFNWFPFILCVSGRCDCIDLAVPQLHPVSMPQTRQYKQSAFAENTTPLCIWMKRASFVPLTFSFCSSSLLLISCRSWTTASSDTVAPTRRLFWPISTARCHRAGECSGSWRESTSPNLRRGTGTGYKARSGARSRFHHETSRSPRHVNACNGTTASQLLYRKYASLKVTSSNEWQWVG